MVPPVAEQVGNAAVDAKQARNRERRYSIRKVAVLGAGTMGARIAGHIANAGLPALLLDIVPKEGDRNAIATAALSALIKSKPAAFTDASLAANVSVGNFEDDLAKLKTCDWVIEAVSENLEIKRSLLAKVVPHLHQNAILTTNTSGLPVKQIAESLPVEVQKRWFGTHFFNPPRYMKLLEVIRTPETDPAALQAVEEFGDLKLGKTVVAANDVPNFIANRIGTFAMMNTFRLMKEQGLSIEQIDVLTGSIVGWPKTGTFRLADMVGIDVLGSVAKNFAAGGGDERSDVELPQQIVQLIERKWLGDKTKQGFYRKQQGADGKEVREVLDLDTFEYKPATRATFAEVDMAKSNGSLPARIKTLLGGDPAKDRVAKFYWSVLPELWTYSANRIGEVAKSIVEIDQAMKAGFNWELGPFEMWDAAGVAETVEKMRSHGQKVPSAVEKLLAAGGTSWYRKDGREYFDPAAETYQTIDENPAFTTVTGFKHVHGVFAENPGVSLVDMGDGIGCFEFHSKMNSLGGDIVTFITKHLHPESEAIRNFDGFVVSSDAPAFSAGANLMQMLLSIQDEEWDDVDLMIRTFQGMTQAIKFSPRPVVAAPFGLCLGGGTEIAMHSALRQAHIELYAGLVETGVGLLPAGGGCKEMILRATAAADAVRADGRGESVEVHEAIKSVFETIAMAKVSTSADEARAMRILEDIDGITMNRARLATDAKAQVIKLVQAGYSAPIPRTDIPAPGPSVLATLKLGVYLMREGEYISDHDVKIAGKVASVLAGGNVTAGTLLTEQYLLDLEREEFLSLCGERKTQERIAFTLKTGRPLRN